jgi:hypothetical protein
MTKKLVILSFLILSTYSMATETNIFLPPSQEKKTIKITKADWDEFDIFSLHMPVEYSGDKHFKLLCSFNAFYEARDSSFVLTHDTIYRGVRYRLDENSCLTLFNFLKRHYEVINDENSLLVTLNLQKLEVESIRWNRPQEGPSLKLNRLSKN